MTQDIVAKSVTECHTTEQRDGALSLEVGSCIWPLVSPAPATDVMVALATTPTQTIYFRAHDIVAICPQ